MYSNSEKLTDMYRPWQFRGFDVVGTDTVVRTRRIATLASTVTSVAVRGALIEVYKSKESRVTHSTTNTKRRTPSVLLSFVEQNTTD